MATLRLTNALQRDPRLGARFYRPMSSRPIVTPVLKASLLAFVAAAALVGTAVRPATAQASTPCWKALLNDWYDGRIDNTYPVHCYREALKHLPSDVQTYSSAHDDILRALQSAIAKQRKAHKQVSNNTLLPPQTGGGSGGSGGSGTGGGPGRDTGGGLAGQVSSDNPSSVPTALLVLGGLALLLVAAGAAGLIAKRVQARRRQP
jgi:hypothetical protein